MRDWLRADSGTLPANRVIQKHCTMLAQSQYEGRVFRAAMESKKCRLLAGRLQACSCHSGTLAADTKDRS